MQKFLLVVVAVIVLVGACAGLGLLMGDNNSWSPRDYVAKPGDCIVYPQGDPLYDAHYAEHVNVPNCGAQVDQSESKLIDAQARALEAETRQSQVVMYLLAGLGFAIVAFFVYAITRGGVGGVS